MAGTLLDVTDLVEFLQREESVSGVQRVVAAIVPLILDTDDQARVVLLDRPRGVFIALSASEVVELIRSGVAAHGGADRGALAAAATACLARAHHAVPVAITTDTVLVFLGAVWINDALMLAARDAHASGAACVYLLYDLTPMLETGHTAAVSRLFDRYLELVTQTGAAVPAISVSTRSDYESYCAERGATAPPGGVTQLPCGITAAQFDTSLEPWPRPYALFVGTVESRKNHILALQAWARLVERHGADRVPDLVCIGRLGWHADDFLRRYVYSSGLDGKVSLLSTGLSDVELARFYAHAEFTVYPSTYEGWGLPVSESLAFGKLPVVADNSSLREAGRDLAVYFTSDDIDSMVSCIEREALDNAARRAHEDRIAHDESPPTTWQQVADVILRDVLQAAARKARTPMAPEIELGTEYVLGSGPPPPDGGYADQYLAYLQAEGLTPMLRQPRGDRDFAIVDAAVIGTFGAPQSWGLEVHPGRRATFRITRPVTGSLSLLLATRSMPGMATVESAGPGGPTREDVYLGSVMSLPLGDGEQGEAAQVSLVVVDASDSVEGFLGLRSFVVLRSDDLTTQVLAYRTAAEALRQELDFMTGTRSWKVTAPLRRFRGRGAV